MKRIKDRWDPEFPEKRRTPQNLVDKASHFEKEEWGRFILFIYTLFNVDNLQLLP